MGFVLPGIDLVSVNDLTQVDAVLQDLVQSSAGVSGATRAVASRTGPYLALNPFSVEVSFELGHAPQFQVEAIQIANQLSFF